MNTTPPAKEAGLTSYQRLVVAILAFLQFTVVLDFMILSPLGAVLIPELDMTTTSFGFVVSAYAFSAGASGFLAAGFADRFDRKRFLLFFYAGFLVGTLLCALATSSTFLLLARMVTGFFAGVIASVSFAIIADLFELRVRGRVMGTVQSAFAAAQVLGLPIGLYLSNHYGWRAPFLMIVGLGLLVGVVIVFMLEPVDAHLATPHHGNAFQHLAATLSNRAYLPAFIATILLVTGGYMLMPLGSAFAVNNLGLGLDELPQLYATTGACSIVAGPLLGRFADRIGKYVMFCAGSALTIAAVLYYTQLDRTPFWHAALVLVVMFIGITGRMVSASALTSAVPEPRSRGAFMAVSSALQQLAGGLAAGATGLIVVQAASGKLEHYPVLGYVVTAATLVTVAVLYVVDRQVRAARG